MSSSPFRDMAQKLSATKDYLAMSYESDRARSHGWWRNVVEHGAWAGPGTNRVGPPTPEAIDGIAKLFGTTPERVREMIAADWYGVEKNTEFSARAKRLAPNLDQLSDDDLELVEQLIRRLIVKR